MNATVARGRLSGRVSIPGSKSHSIRALVIAALADGVSRISAPLESEDTASCIRVLRQLGIQIEEVRDADGALAALIVVGSGGKLRQPATDLDCGNSGTTFYVMLSTAALAGVPVTLTGDDQLQRRSAGPLLTSLEQLGATVGRHHGDCAPVTITGPLRGGETSIECPTSQYLTSLLLAAPLVERQTVISVPLLNERPYVEMTLAWLASQGITVERSGWSKFVVNGGRKYSPFERRIPGDFSAATFFLAAAAITGSSLELEGLDMADSQGDTAVVSILEGLGCEVDRLSDGIRIAGPQSGLPAGGTFDLNAIPDALPALAVVGTACSQPMHLTNVPQARQKETDRIAVMAHELSALGARVEELPDGLVVHPSELAGGTVSSHGDHRVAMALAVAALRALSPVTITDAGVAAITFPGFFDALAACGARVSTE